jgi:imidazolonepropionase-like amidohydrolase
MTSPEKETMTMRTSALCLLIPALVLVTVLGAASQADGGSAPGHLVLTNAHLVDPVREVQQPSVTVLIKGERIDRVFADGTEALPDGAQVIDLEGRYLIPGLVNTHVHFHQLDDAGGRARVDRELRRMLYGGVTAVRDMAGDLRLQGTIERDLELGRVVGPDFYYPAVFNGAAWWASDPRAQRWPTGRMWRGEVTPETDPRIAVGGAAGAGARAIKFYTGIDTPVIRALTEEAHRQGLQVWAHSTVFPGRPIELIRAGVNGVSHGCYLAWQAEALDPSVNVPYVHTGQRAIFDPELVDLDGPEYSALASEMRARGTTLDATNSLFMDGRGAGAGCTPDFVIEVSRWAQDAGIWISTGTDYFVDESDPWPAVLREIEHFVDHNIMTPAEALTAATLNGARAIGIEDTHGTIEPGKAASLVIYLIGEATFPFRTDRRFGIG